MRSVCTISIVSHGDEASVIKMLLRSQRVTERDNIEIVIRENKQSICRGFEDLAFKNKNISVFYNERVRGFGANHNLNFHEGRPDAKFFVICNPDLREIPDLAYLDNLKSENFFGTPLIREMNGEVADFRRGDIGIGSLIKRFLNLPSDTSIETSKVTWVPSVFKIFARDLYANLNGYDEKIFMYYEDYDICMRASSYGSLEVINDMEVWHEGRRASRNNIKLFLHHLSSILYVKWKHRGK